MPGHPPLRKRNQRPVRTVPFQPPCPGGKVLRGPLVMHPVQAVADPAARFGHIPLNGLRPHVEPHPDSRFRYRNIPHGRHIRGRMLRGHRIISIRQNRQRHGIATLRSGDEFQPRPIGRIRQPQPGVRIAHDQETGRLAAVFPRRIGPERQAGRHDETFSEETAHQEVGAHPEIHRSRPVHDGIEPDPAVRADRMPGRRRDAGILPTGRKAIAGPCSRSRVCGFLAGNTSRGRRGLTGAVCRSRKSPTGAIRRSGRERITDRQAGRQRMTVRGGDRQRSRSDRRPDPVPVRIGADHRPAVLRPAHRLEVDDAAVGAFILEMEEPVATVRRLHPRPLMGAVDARQRQRVQPAGRPGASCHSVNSATLRPGFNATRWHCPGAGRQNAPGASRFASGRSHHHALLKRPPGAAGAQNCLPARSDAARGSEEVTPSIPAVKFGPFDGRLGQVSVIDNAGRAQQTGAVRRHFGHEQDTFQPRPGTGRRMGEVGLPVAVPQRAGIDETLSAQEPDRLGPGTGGVLRPYHEDAAVGIAAEDMEPAVMIPDGRRPHAVAGRDTAPERIPVLLGERRPGIFRQGSPDLPPVDQVPGMQDGQAGETVERGGGQVVVLPHPADVRVAVVQVQDRIGITEYRIPFSGMVVNGGNSRTATGNGKAERQDQADISHDGSRNGYKDTRFSRICQQPRPRPVTS